MVFVSAFQGLFSTYSHLLILPSAFKAGDKTAATFTGTHEPGQFCFFISGPTPVLLGPAVITSPSNLQIILQASIQSVSFIAQGLLNSREYSITVNGKVIVASIFSTSTATLSTTLDLSAFTDISLTISLIRISDTTTSASVTIRKTFVSITTPVSSGYINALTATDFQVEDWRSLGDGDCHFH